MKVTILLLFINITIQNQNCQSDQRCKYDCSASNYCCSNCTCRNLIKYQISKNSFKCDSSKCIQSNNNYCYKCADGYYLYDQVCYSCDYHCLKCTSKDICTQCESSYQLVDNQCKRSVSIDLCLEMDESDSDECDQCVEDAYLSDNKKKCICRQGYEIDDNSCKKCLSICDGCQNTHNYCTACKNDALMNPIQDGVCTCKDGNFWNGNSCSACNENCLKCEDSADSCTDCVSNLQLSEQSVCVCQSGTYPLSTTYPYSCQPCSKNCFYCEGSPNECTDCYQNYQLVSKLCICPVGYFEINNECISCKWPCIKCTSLTDCLQCESNFNIYTTSENTCLCFPGYYIVESERVCKQCDNNCKTCENSPTFCLSCYEEQDRVLSENQCICGKEYFLSYDQICMNCGSKESITFENCKYKDCADGIWSYGEQCDDGNNIVRDGCQNCYIQESFYCFNIILQPSQCFKCMENCLLCVYNQENSQIQCQKAEFGYFIENLTKIQKCSNKCLNCEHNPSQCTVCRFLNVGKEKLECQLCEYNDGYYSNYEDSKCYTKCGDSQKADIEECDDGNLDNGDGCDNSCHLEKSYDCQNGICNQIQLPEPIGEQVQIFDIYIPQRQVMVRYEQILNISSLFQIEDVIEVTFSSNEANINFTYNITQNLEFQQLNQYNLSYLINIQVDKSISNASISIEYLQPSQIKNLQNQEQKQIHLNVPITNVVIISQTEKQLTQNTVNTSNSLIYILFALMGLGILFGGLDIYFNLIDTIQYISYLYYINTIFPFNVNQFFENLNFAQFTVVQDFINLDEIFTVELGYDLELHSITVPFKIKKQGFMSCFLLNFSSIFSVFAISISIYIIARIVYQKLLNFRDLQKEELLEYSDKNNRKLKVQIWISQIKHILLIWSSTMLSEYFYSDLLRIFLTTANEYCFIINLGFKGLDFNNYFGIINSILTFIFFGAYLIITFFSFKIVSIKNYVTKTPSYQSKFGSLLDGMIVSRYSKYFNPIVLIKKFLFMMFLVQIYEYPIFQATCILILNLPFLLYMLIYIPIKEKLELKKQIICEISQTFTISLFCLFCINDQIEFLGDQNLLNIGWLIIANVIIALSAQVVINTIQQWQYLYKKYKFIQKLANKVKEIYKKCNPKENPNIKMFI